MTREEKTNLLNELLECEENNDIGNLTRAERREFQQWISEELEQEPILDKIRAEVKALNPEPTAYDVVDGNPIKDAVWKALADVLKIIDKYKAESEEIQ